MILTLTDLVNTITDQSPLAITKMHFALKTIIPVRHGMGHKNDKGERICNFSVTNGLVIKGTLFQQKIFTTQHGLSKWESEESD